MKYLFVLLVFSQFRLSAQDSLSLGDTTLISGNFTVSLGVFKEGLSMGEMKNQGELYADLWNHCFTPKEEFREVDGIYFTKYLEQNIFLNRNALYFQKINLEINTPCLFYDCYSEYIYKIKTKRFWRKINKKSKYHKPFYGNDLSYVDLTCEFKCVYLGKHQIRTVNPQAKNREQAYTKSLANVYAIIEINKIVPIPHKED